MNLDLIKPTSQEIIDTALLFSRDDPRRRQLIALLAFDEAALRKLRKGHDEDKS